MSFRALAHGFSKNRKRARTSIKREPHMKAPWSKDTLQQGLGRWVLASWLIATGLLPLLHIGNATLGAVLNITAIAAGVLLLLNR